MQTSGAGVIGVHERNDALKWPPQNPESCTGYPSTSHTLAAGIVRVHERNDAPKMAADIARRAKGRLPDGVNDVAVGGMQRAPKHEHLHSKAAHIALKQASTHT